MNTADLPGENHDYPEADWERREDIADRHRRHALGLLYFLQNDDAVPETIRSEAREWGLARDEFTDDDNFPWQLYVREARRIEGRYTFRAGDGRLAPGLDRAPIHHDSVTIAEYPLDSHACTTEHQRGSHADGGFYASQVTRPAHVPYRTLLPEGVDNLLVPGPLSATHVGYSMLRLEPTWMHIGEVAGVAATLAVESGSAPAALDASRLQRALVERAVLLSFFNEFDAGDEEPWVPAVQFLGTKGFFDAYDARPEAPLSGAVAPIWAAHAARLLAGDLGDASERARELPEADGSAVTGGAFVDLLADALDCHGVETGDPRGALTTLDIEAEAPLSRGDACRVVYRLGE
jgi:hypothetical protein